MSDKPAGNKKVRYDTSRDALEQNTEVDFFTGSGPGGQHRNRTRTAVRLRHLPSGIVVTATERRSQSHNLETAYKRLQARLRELNKTRKKRRPTRPSKAARERRLQGKARRARKKQLRRSPSSENC